MAVSLDSSLFFFTGIWGKIVFCGGLFGSLIVWLLVKCLKSLRLYRWKRRVLSAISDEFEQLRETRQDEVQRFFWSINRRDQQNQIENHRAEVITLDEELTNLRSCYESLKKCSWSQLSELYCEDQIAREKTQEMLNRFDQNHPLSKKFNLVSDDFHTRLLLSKRLEENSKRKEESSNKEGSELPRRSQPEEEDKERQLPSEEQKPINEVNVSTTSHHDDKHKQTPPVESERSNSDNSNGYESSEGQKERHTTDMKSIRKNELKIHNLLSQLRQRKHNHMLNQFRDYGGKETPSA